MATHTPDETTAPSSERAAASPIDRHGSPVAETTGKSGKATTSMVLGIIGVLAGALIPILGLILGGIALGLGLTARSQIRERGLTGMGNATAGTILGIIAIVVSLAVWIAAVAMMS
jgi:hypothetical protein